jgi:TRAP-type uncharacterized transport system substrate-binding protein
MLKLFILIIILIIIFYILNKYFFRKKVEEHYLTYFLPFYDNQLPELTNFYKEKEYNLNYFKKKFNYKKIRIGFYYLDEDIIKLLISNYIAKSNRQNIELVKYSHFMNNLKDLISGKNDFSVTIYSTIVYYIEVLKKDLSNVRLVTNLNKYYIFTFTLKRYNIFSLNQIPSNTTIGILDDNDPFYFYYKKYLKDLGYKEHIDYEVKVYPSLKELFNGFLNYECQMIFILRGFPNVEIQNFIDNNSNYDIILLPFDILKEDLFLKRNRPVNIDYIDLNNLANSYLPVKFGNYEYVTYRCNLKICYFYKILVTNNNLDKDYVYNFMEFYNNNIDYINNNLTDQQRSYKFEKVSVVDKLDYLTYHEGVLDFFKKYGYISNIDNDNCKYLVGKMECNEENLANNNFLTF